MVFEKYTSALDPTNQAAVRDTIMSVKEGHTTLLIMHNLWWMLGASSRRARSTSSSSDAARSSSSRVRASGLAWTNLALFAYLFYLSSGSNTLCSLASIPTLTGVSQSLLFHFWFYHLCFFLVIALHVHRTASHCIHTSLYHTAQLKYIDLISHDLVCAQRDQRRP